MTFIDNHDMSRAFTQLSHDKALYKMALSILLTTRGIPQIFYGSEIAMANPTSDDHGIIRSDFPGGWPDDNKNVFNGTGLSEQQDELLTFTKTLLNWRKRCDRSASGAAKTLRARKWALSLWPLVESYGIRQ